MPHRLEFPHSLDALTCPNCGHRASRAPVLHPETGEHLEAGDQFALHGVEFDHHAALIAEMPNLLAALFSAPPESIHIRCPKCEHHAHGAAFGLAAHLEGAQ